MGLLGRRRILAAAAGGLGAVGLGAGILGAKPEAKMNGEAKRMPVVFVPHGGGPWPVLPLDNMDRAETEALAGYMRSISSQPPVRPTFLVVLSAHWEAERVTVHVGPRPGMYFDYSGFPPAAYELSWPAPGAPEHGEVAIELLRSAGFEVERETSRGFDHGTFIPLLLAFPAADVPVVQVSLKRGLDPAEHLAIGKALAPLRDRGGFIVGSGNSYHNLRKFFRPDAAARAEAVEFDDWLNKAVMADARERARLLTGWTQAPAARACHPREEHLIPLMVAAGAAGDDSARVVWRGTASGLRVSAHAFG
jgi:aromatic ring-opening dioxygenase catalytic subunit (LigB family)